MRIGISQGKPKAGGRIETGQVFEQKISIDEGQTPWRRIELRLDTQIGRAHV